MLGQTNQTGDQVLNNTSEKLSKLENQVNDLYRALTKFSDINLGNINADGMNSVIDKAQRIITELGNIRQSSFSNIGQALDVFDEVLRRLNEDFDKLKNNSNNTMFSGVKESIDKIGQSSADLKNYLQDATVSLDNFFRLMRDQNSANFFSSVLNKDLEQLSKNLSTSSGQLVDLYGKLREMQMIAGTFGSEFASKSLSGLSDVYTKISDITRGLEALQKASSQVTNFGFENPDVIFKQFQDIIDKSKQMIASTHTEISNVSNDMSKYTTTQLSLGLSNLETLTQGVQKEVGQIEKYAGNLLGILQSNSQKLTDILQDQAKITESGKSKDELEKIQTNTQNYISQIQQLVDRQRSEFANDTNKLMQDYAKIRKDNMETILGNLMNNSDDDYGKLLNMIESKKHVNRFEGKISNIGSSAEDLMNIASPVINPSMNITQKLRSMFSIDSDSIMENTEKVNKLIQYLVQTKDQVTQQLHDAMDKYSNSGDERDLLSAQNKYRELLTITEQLNRQALEYQSTYNVSSNKQFKSLHGDNQRELTDIGHIIKQVLGADQDVMTVGKALHLPPEEIKALQDYVGQLSNMSNELDKIQNKSESLFSKIKSGFGDFFAPLSGVSKAFGLIGAGAIPLSLSGLKSYWGGVLSDYTTQGQMEARSAQTEFGMGDYVNFPGAADRVHRQASYYYGMSNGLIGFQDYNNAYTNLARNVGGQYNVSDQQAVGDLQKITDQTFLLSKLYNISDSTMADTVKTFYKELQMGADETSFTMMKLTQTATAANIPVEQYMRTVSQLALQFRNIGINGNVAVNMMDNFVAGGMRADTAQQMTQAAGQAMSNFGENNSLMAFTGIMTGQFNNPWSAMRFGLDKFDANGNVRSEYAPAVAKNIDYYLQLNGAMGGGNQDLQYVLVNRALRQMGFNSQQADIGTDQFMNNRKMFEDWISKQQTPEESQQEMQEKMVSQMETVANQLAGTTKIEADLAKAQWDLATEVEGVLDPTLSTVEDAIFKLTEKIEELTATIVNAIVSFSKTPFFQDVVKPTAEWALDNPIGALGVMAGIKYVGAPLIKGAAKKAGGGIVSGVKNLFGRKGSGNAVDDVIDEATSRAGSEAVEHGVDEAVEKGASEALEKGSTKLISKAGKIGGIIAAVGGAIWLGNQLFGGSGESSMPSVNPNDISEDAKFLGNKLDLINMTVGTSGTGVIDNSFIYNNGGLSNYGMPSPILPSGYNTVNSRIIQTQLANLTPYELQQQLINGVVNPGSFNPTLGGGYEDAFINDSTGGILGLGVNLAANKYFTNIGKNQLNQIVNSQKLVDSTGFSTHLATNSLDEAKALRNDEIRNFLKGGSQEDMAAANGLIRDAEQGLRDARSAEKAAQEGLERATGTLAGKFGVRGVQVLGEGATAGLVDMALGGIEYGSLALSGKEVGGDFGNIAAKTLGNAAFDTAGAAIGTAILPGVGTVVGAVVAPIIKDAINGATADALGHGVFDKWQMAWSGGLTEQQLNSKRSYLNNGDITPLLMEQLQRFGFGDDQSVKISDALENHASTIKSLSDQDKIQWGQMYQTLMEQGMSDADAVKTALDLINSGQLKDQLAAANAEGLQKALESTGIKISVDQAMQIQRNAAGNISSDLKLPDNESEVTRGAVLNVIGKHRNQLTGSLSTMNNDQLWSVYTNPNNDLNKLLTEIIAPYKDEIESAKLQVRKQLNEKSLDRQLNSSNDLDLDVATQGQQAYKLNQQQIIDLKEKPLQSLIDPNNPDIMRKLVSQTLKEVQNAYDSADQQGKAALEPQLVKLMQLNEGLNSDQFKNDWARGTAIVKNQNPNASEELINQKVAEWMETNSQQAVFLQQARDKSAEWVQQIEDEINNGSTQMLDKFHGWLSDFDKTNIIFQQIIENLTKLQSNGDIKLDNGNQNINLDAYGVKGQNDLVNEMRKMTFTKDPFKDAATLSSLVGIDYKTNGMDLKGMDDLGWLRFIGMQTGLVNKNFSAKDLFDPNKFSASNLNNLKVGDVLYRANIINQDEIDDWEMKYQKADEAGKKKLLQNQPTPQEDVDLGIYLGEGKVSTMVNDKEGGKGNGSRIISLEDFRATGAATSKEAKENAKTTNDTIDTRIKDTIDSMVLLHGQDKESYGAIEKAVKDSSWSDVDKKSALDYLSKIVQNGLGGGSGSGSGTGGLNPTLGAGTGNDFGSLARDYESDGDVGAITLADSRGTSAFGLYQFNSGGQLPDLMSYIAKQNPDFFNKYFGSDVWNAMDESGKGFKDSAFVNAWKSAAMYDPTVFGQLQQNYGVKTNYTDVIEPFKNQFGIDLTQRSRALQEAIMSTEIQHGAGGAWDVFKDALNKYGKDANNISDEQLLRDIYASRSDNNPSSSSRYVNELNSALVMLQQYGLKPENDPNAFYLPVDKLNISSGFMDTKNRTKPHQGIDLAGNPEGSDIYAAKGGTITKVLPTDQSNGYGNMVVITDENGNQYTYGHMQDGSLDSLKEGMDISAGQVIGHVGSTGNSTGPHLHFEMKDANGKVIDPTNYITNAQKPSYVDNELFSNPSVPVTPSGNPSDLLMPGTGKLVGNVFTDGSLMYDYLPASLRSSYMTNDANTKFSLLNEAKAIRSAYGNNPDPTYDVQAMAATNRLDFDKQIFSNSGVRNDFTTDYQLPYGTELSSVSGLVSSGASGSSPTFSVKFNYDSQGVDDIAFNSFVKRVQGFIESIGGQVEQVQDDLGTVKTSVKVVADNVDTLTTKITNDSKF